MNKNNKRLRGATIAELIIVLAVLTIISTIVISFVAMSNENVRQSSQKVDALNDIAVVENIVDAWLSSEMRYLSSEYSETHKEKKRLALHIDHNELYKEDSLLFFDFTTKKLNSSFNGSDVTYEPETVTDIEILFKQREETNKETGGTMIVSIAICYITYELVLSDSTVNEYTYSFVVYPYDSINTVIPEVPND